ncbi:MAG: hypothetical protein P1P87_12910 [Trueperaceae bacterium]|nr:hypothetical protein [Trueperaceae bacterium]
MPALAATLGNLGERLQEAGLPGARAAFAEAVALYDDLGVPACAPLVGLAEKSGAVERLRLARRAVAEADAIDDVRVLAFGHALLARLAADEGDRDEAARRFVAAVAAASRADPVARTHVLRDRAHWHHAQGAREAALADLVAALEAAMAARMATPLLLVARAAAWRAALAQAANDGGPDDDRALGQRVLDVLYATAEACELPRWVASSRAASGRDAAEGSAARGAADAQLGSGSSPASGASGASRSHAGPAKAPVR